MVVGRTAAEKVASFAAIRVGGNAGHRLVAVGRCVAAWLPAASMGGGCDNFDWRNLRGLGKMPAYGFSQSKS